jgi:cell division protein FtsI (penicillin-binding protein 3)
MKLIERRVGLLFAFFAIAFCGVLLRAAWLQTVKGDEFSASARSQQVATVEVPGARGAILDRRGEPLAVSEDAATIFATPYQVENLEKTADKLGEALDEKSAAILEILSSDAGFEYIQRRVDLVTADKIERMELPGIGIVPDSRRVYPQGEIGARLIGAVGTDDQGLFGIEGSKEDVLAGSDGELAVTRDALGEEIGRDVITEATTGHDVQLTIDGKIQAETESVMAELGETYQPEGATAIVMDPDNGDIVAMSSWPPIDPTNLEDVDGDLLSNMATSFTYEPGSTFKAFTVAGAEEDGLVKPTTTFDLPPTIQVADRVIEESHPRGAMTMTVAEILKVSSNVGAVTIGLELNDGAFGDRFDYWVRRFGFATPTGIDYPGEEMGILPAPKDYSGSTMGNLPIGQGLSVTPLQMMAGYAAIANGGTLRTPRLVQSVDGEESPVDEGEQIIGEKTARDLRRMLEGVVESDGTAPIEVPGYVLAGKTGTSQKVVDGTYSEVEYVASFVGFAPAEDPELLAAVVVDYPKGDIYGGSVAAPAFAKIASFALPYLGIPPD